MTEIDLIPGDYRRVDWLRGRTRLTVIALVAALGFTAVVWGGLHLQSSRLTAQISELQQQQAITNQQREVLSQLGMQKTALQRKLELLTGLRGGSEAVQMFVTVDHALEGDEVWFTDWEFQRAGQAVENVPETTQTGYFIVIPEDDGSDSNEAWKIETHMTLKGQARDHSALSGFVRRLYRQHDIEDVRILGTTRKPNSSLVDFRLAVTVNSAGGGA